jgi:hypothetical protein
VIVDHERRSPVSALAALAALAMVVTLPACRSCDDREAPGGAGPPMPSGMLVPTDAAPPPAEALAERLRSSRTARPGWFELAPEGSGKGEPLWVSVTGFALMENSFARAQPGFGPFGARIVQPDSMQRLAKELRAQRAEWVAVPTAAAAKAKWPAAEALRDVATDEAWRAARDAFAVTLDDVAAYVENLGAVGVGLRVGAR